MERQRNQDGEGHAGDISRTSWKLRAEPTTEKVRRRRDHPYGIADGGVIIHEIGTARMGSNPKTSVLNGYCQAHDVKNLFVTDAPRL